MASYYYLISSLPSLKSDTPAPIDYSQFLTMCKSSVSASVYENLENLSVNSDKGQFLSKWAEFAGGLKNELDCLRNGKLGKPVVKTEEHDNFICSTAQSAFNAENPLEAEKIILKAQFDFLDSLVSMHYFDDYVLYGYAVKLKLLERQNIFDFEKGSKEFKRLFDSIQQQILSI